MNRYNHTRRLFMSGGVDIANLKIMLLNGHTFDPTNTDMTGITPNEVSGNGWAAGGELLNNAAVTTVDTSSARLDADDISVTATGGEIGPADMLVIYDATNNAPLYNYEFPSSQTAGVGTPFNVTISASGIEVVSNI